MDSINFNDVAFPFTEQRIEQALRLLAAGKVGTDAEGRKLWRDQGSGHGLYLRASAGRAVFYRISKSRGRKTKVRIGDATTTRVTVAREKAIKLAGGDQSAAAPLIRVRTDGPTVAKAWGAYMAEAASGEFVAGRKPAAASTLKSYEELYRPHLKKQYGDRSLHALARDVAKIHRSLREKPATANRLLQIISNLFVHAASAGHWDKPNPTLDPARGRPIRKYTVASRERWLTTAEATRVMEYAATEGDPWRDFWQLLVLTATRVSNLREMQWAELDLRDTDSDWRIPKTKNGSSHVVPLTDRAVKILRDRLARVPKADDKKSPRPKSIWVFPMKTDDSRCITDCDHAWARVKKHAILANVRIHDLRRTAGSWATQAGAPLTAVGRFIGDKSINATAVYARADMAASRSAAQMVEQRLLEAVDKTQGRTQRPK